MQLVAFSDVELYPLNTQSLHRLTLQSYNLHTHLETHRAISCDLESKLINHLQHGFRNITRQSNCIPAGTCLQDSFQQRFAPGGADVEGK